MPKNIIFCADGTWNRPHAADSDDDDDDSDSGASNVFKLFLRLEGADDQRTALLAKEQERRLTDQNGVVQIAKYLHGVGDSHNLLARLLGGGVGTGPIARVVRGYTFISRNYEPDDRIYLVGFSRGAYTARALAGLISAKGLLSPADASGDDKDEAYRKGSAVWYGWRKDVLGSQGLSLEELFRDLPSFFQEDGRAEMVRPAPIRMVAVWDTVGGLGIPIYDKRGTALDAFKFADLKLNDNISLGRHAISIDERRENFTPTLWDPDNDPMHAPDRIVQVLFPGGHSDVGGGCPVGESGLSDCALQWMARELRRDGVKIAPLKMPRTRNPLAKDHREWEKFGWNSCRQGFGCSRPRPGCAFPRRCCSGTRDSLSPRMHRATSRPILRAT